MPTVAVAIDLLSSKSFAEGHPVEQYRWLRGNSPVYWHDEPDGPGFWAVTTYDLVREVSKRPDVFSSAAGGIMINYFPPEELEFFRTMILVMDPPKHSFYRRLVGGTHRDHALRTRCGHRRTAVRRDGRDHRRRRPGAQRQAGQPGRRPGQPVIAEVDGRRLTEQEFSSFFLLLVNAGGDTSRNLISGATVSLLRRRPLFERLRDESATLMPTAVDELLRFHSPVIYMRRTAVHDTVLGGVQIGAGDKVALYYGAANGDPAMFDHPDELVLDRTPNEHVAFGAGGPHFCISVGSRHQMMSQLLARFGDLELAGEPTWLASNFIFTCRSGSPRARRSAADRPTGLGRRRPRPLR
jgi:cytochrome P450